MNYNIPELRNHGDVTIFLYKIIDAMIEFEIEVHLTKDHKLPSCFKETLDTLNEMYSSDEWEEKALTVPLDDVIDQIGSETAETMSRLIQLFFVLNAYNKQVKELTKQAMREV